MSKLKEIILGISLSIPLAPYEVLKSPVKIKVKADENETEEEVFINAYEKLWEVFEGRLALDMAKIMKIKNDAGLLNFARELGEDIGVNNNRFADAYLKTLKPKEETKNG